MSETPHTELRSSQRRHLRALGHHLQAVVHLGKQGISDGVVSAVDEALTTHELVKVRLNQNAAVDRHEAANELANRTDATVAQVLGTTLLLYRPDPDEPKIFAS